ncbi:MAG: hypothetical protein IJJ47_13760 [Methanosphaera sp.]|nr:hypothetical protein [Methanosphaera sp.]
MKKIKQLLLFAIVLILLVGVVSASEVSKDKTGTNSITKKAVKHDTHKVSYAANKIQEKKADENIITKKSINKTDKNSITTKKSVKSSKVKVVTVNNWEELKSAANNATGK